ncbi:TRAP transporter substrate-binding protein DctP [Thalassospira sp. HF15]|uniref:TRAP transporter substrate-binding protein DctP n=1 Tax=Thalassospira sp. HF15 TaxID=2722755 RepID=UPI0014316097|nr:TRAP transporter substrate-binding protein DctP [Thalassospira sp. HF15]NIY76023.1 TRAP transporter substrate-binding protein DctP [Thalassospira sp. HF15]
MKIFNKTLTASVAAISMSVAAFGMSASAGAETLKLSHQWSTSDVRHKVAEIIANEVKAADVDLEIQIFPSGSLFKAKEQWTPMTRGQLDMIVYPLAYAGGRIPATNLTLMPALVKNHDHAQRINESPFMAKIEELLNEDGVVTVAKGWLAGGFASTQGCIKKPEDVKGMQIRAAGKSFEQMLQGAGGSIAAMPSSEIYPAMQTGVLDAANTSSSSFVSYRIYEQVKCYTPAAGNALWFMYQPVLMSKRSYDKLNDAQKDALAAAAKKAEAYYTAEGRKQDSDSVQVFKEAGVEIADLSDEDFAAWQAIAMKTSYAKFVEETPNGQELLDMALAVK